MTDNEFQARQFAKYKEALAALVPGTRDSGLPALTIFGRLAGMTPDELYHDIMDNAPGGKRPSAAAVRRAVDHATRTVEFGGRGASRKDSRFVAYDRIWTKKEPSAKERRESTRKALPDDVRGYVHSLIEYGRGANSKTLREMSPTPIPDSHAEQAAAHLEAIGADWRWKLWAGTIGQGIGKHGGVISATSLADSIRAGLAEIPTHVSLNPVTGMEGRTKDGKPSFDCEETVAAFPFALLEFDAMPLLDQCALFSSLIRKMPGRIVSLVYSGGKSIHGVMLIPECDDRRMTTKTLADQIRDERTPADDKKWESSVAELRFAFASSDNPAERIDEAPLESPAFHTRLAGAYRKEKGRRQGLLYLDAVLARRTLEIF